MDHSVSNGPIDRWQVDELVGIAAESGADAVVLHRGRLRDVEARWFDRIGLVVHLSASTVHSEDPNAKVLVASVEEAISWAADAVSVHVNIGSPTETQQLCDLGMVAEHCRRWGMPLIAMMYARGAGIADGQDPEVVAHVANIAVDLGADIVKASYTGSISSMADVVSSCPIPILVAGGPALDSSAQVVTFVSDVMSAGAGGVAMGRNVFTADQPRAVVQAVAAIVHGDAPPETATAPTIDLRMAVGAGVGGGLDGSR